jgi:hypothetical protein
MPGCADFLLEEQQQTAGLNIHSFIYVERKKGIEQVLSLFTFN